MCHKMSPVHSVWEIINVENRRKPISINDLFTDLTRRRNALSSVRQRKHAGQGASYGTYSKASITLETVVILPLFICFMVFFLFLFRVLEVQECMEEALLYASRTLAAECYSESPNEQKTGAQLLAGAHLMFADGLNKSACPTGFIRGGKLGISLLSSELAGDEVMLCASYEMKLPVRLLGVYSYRFCQCAQSRKWIGDITLNGEREDEEWVYITPRGSVYHLTRGCPYLDLSIRAVGKASVGELRNASRGSYKSCESCGKTTGGTVYVTDYGDRYHGSLSCVGLKRTIYMVKISEVGGKKVCSKCGGR